jgi:hypothetical protein
MPLALSPWLPQNFNNLLRTNWNRYAAETNLHLPAGTLIPNCCYLGFDLFAGIKFDANTRTNAVIHKPSALHIIGSRSLRPARTRIATEPVELPMRHGRIFTDREPELKSSNLTKRDRGNHAKEAFNPLGRDFKAEKLHPFYTSTETIETGASSLSGN